MRRNLQQSTIATALASFVLCFAISIWPAPAKADVEDDIRSVISQQIDAFRRDDATAAYAFAAPNIQRLFGTPDRFMDMVRTGYDPVYRPGVYEFGPYREASGGYEQIVDIIDRSGNGWRALYTLVADETGALRISSCVLVERPLTGA